MKEKHGGTAFPRPLSHVPPSALEDYESAQDGMTMRQWYKGMALLGLLASGKATTIGSTTEMVVELANAMLTEDEINDSR